MATPTGAEAAKRAARCQALTSLEMREQIDRRGQSGSGGRRALLSLTTGGPPDAYQSGGFNGDIDGILRPIHRGMLQFIGFDVPAPHIVYQPVRLTKEKRAVALEAWTKSISNFKSRNEPFG